MPVVGRITAKFDADTKDLDASLKGIEGAVNGTSVQVTAGFSKMEGSLAKSTKAIQKSGQQTKDAIDQLVLKDKLEAGVALFGRISGAVDGFRQELNRAGGEADDLRDRLSATFGELADEKAKLAEDQLKLGFDADSTANALVTLKKFGADTEDTLKRLQDAARFTNTDIAGLAESFGRFEKFGDAKSLKALQKELGISNQDLERFGAKLDATGKPLLDTEARVKAAAQALRDYQAVNFAGAAERQADAATRVTGELEALKREVGLNVTQFKEGFSPAILTVVQGLRGMSDGTKAAIGLGVEFVGQAASMAATALSLGSQLVIMSGNAKLASIGIAACNTATAAFTATLEVALGPLGLVALAVTGLALAVAQYNNDLAEAADNAVVLAAAQDKGIIRYEKNKDLIGKNADELRKMGKTAKDVGQLVEGLNAKQQEARAANDGAGDKVAEERYLAEARAANKVRSELEKIEAAEDKRKNPAATGSSVDDLSEKERAKLAKQKESDQKKADALEEKARKESLDKQLDLVKQQAAAGEITKQQQIDGLRDVLNNSRATAAEQRTIQIQIAQLQGQIRKEETAAAATEDKKRTAEAKAEAAKRGRETAKAEADAKRAAKADDAQGKADLAQIERLAGEKANAEKSAIDKQIQGLDPAKDLATIQRLINAKLAITEAEINAEKDATLKATKNEEVKVAAIAAAEAKIKAARADATTALKAETDKQKAAIQSVVDKQADAVAQTKRLTTDLNGLPSSDPTQGLGIDLSQKLELVKDRQKTSAKSFGVGDVSIKSQVDLIDKQLAKLASPLYADTSGGAKKIDELTTKRAEILAGKLKLKPVNDVLGSSDGKVMNIVAPQIDPKLTPAAQASDALKQAQISVTVQNIIDGQDAGSKTFSGTADELSKNLQTFNPDHMLGKP